MVLTKKEETKSSSLFKKGKDNLPKLIKYSAILIGSLILLALIIAFILNYEPKKSKENIVLKIDSVYITPDDKSAVIVLSREGRGEMTKIEFNFYDFDSNSYLYTYDLKEGLPKDGEIKTYIIDSSFIPDLSSFLLLDYIDIIYYYINSDGEEVFSSIQDSFGNKQGEDLRDPINNVINNPAPKLPPKTSPKSSGSSSSGNSNNEIIICDPDPLTVTCSGGKCGMIKNNCNTLVDCGSCTPVSGEGSNDIIITDKCNSNSDCGIDTFRTTKFCQTGSKDVFAYYVSYTCNNPASLTSTCSSTTLPKIYEPCVGSTSCRDGICAVSCIPESISVSCNGKCGIQNDNCGNPVNCPVCPGSGDVGGSGDSGGTLSSSSLTGNTLDNLLKFFKRLFGN